MVSMDKLWKGVSRVLDAQLRREIVLTSGNRTGLLAEISRLLVNMGINLLSIAVTTAGETAVIRLLATSQSYARDSLREAGFRVEERDVVVIELPHYPGFLCRVSEALARKEISLDDLHTTVSEEGSTEVVVFSCSDNGRAVQMLRGR
jgi:hypothetical protein